MGGGSSRARAGKGTAVATSRNRTTERTGGRQRTSPSACLRAVLPGFALAMMSLMLPMIVDITIAPISMADEMTTFSMKWSGTKSASLVPTMSTDIAAQGATTM